MSAASRSTILPASTGRFISRRSSTTFVLSLATAFFTLILSYPIAFALVRTKVEWVRTLLILLSITPLFTGEIVRTYAWMLVLGTNGFLNTMLLDIGVISEPVTFMYTRAGVVIALVQFAMPVMIIILATAISHINTDYEKAAANLGARPWTVITRVVIPLTMPGIISGFIVIFAWTMSAFATPQLIGGGKVLMISNAIYLQASRPSTSPRRHAQRDRADQRLRQPGAHETRRQPP